MQPDEPDQLPVLVVFDRPSDYPDHVVLRRTDVTMHGVLTRRSAALFDSLDEARAWIAATYPQLTLVPRSPYDHEAIVESWL